MAKASENILVYKGSQQRYGHNPQLRAGRIPWHDKHSHKLNTNNLEVRTPITYQYLVHKAELLLLEVLNLYSTLPNVILPVSLPSIFLIWFRTRIIGNTSNVVGNSYTPPFSKSNLKQLELSNTVQMTCK
jgi:hypothetical protein